MSYACASTSTRGSSGLLSGNRRVEAALSLSCSMRRVANRTARCPCRRLGGRSWCRQRPASRITGHRGHPAVCDAWFTRRGPCKVDGRPTAAGRTPARTDRTAAMTSERNQPGRDVLPIPDRSHIGLTTYDATRGGTPTCPSMAAPTRSGFGHEHDQGHQDHPDHGQAPHRVQTSRSSATSTSPPHAEPAARCHGRCWLELLTASCRRFILERNGSVITTRADAACWMVLCGFRVGPHGWGTTRQRLRDASRGRRPRPRVLSGESTTSRLRRLPERHESNALQIGITH